MSARYIRAWYVRTFAFYSCDAAQSKKKMLLDEKCGGGEAAAPTPTPTYTHTRFRGP